MYRYDWIWEKDKPSNFAMAHKQPLRYTENIIIFYKKYPTYNPQMWIGNKNHSVGKGIRNKSNEINCPSSVSVYYNNKDSNLKYPKNILKFNRETKPIHPTQKPVALLEYLIRTYTNEGETVLDNAAGSGSTGVACVNTNRDFIGIELDERYFQIAQNRINQAIADKDGE